jgi:hypothetical protein
MQKKIYSSHTWYFYVCMFLKLRHVFNRKIHSLTHSLIHMYRHDISTQKSYENKTAQLSKVLRKMEIMNRKWVSKHRNMNFHEKKKFLVNFRTLEEIYSE